MYMRSDRDFNSLEIEENPDLATAFQEVVEVLTNSGLQFATAEEAESKKVNLLLKSPSMDKGYILMFQQFGSDQDPETLNKRVEGFNYIIRATSRFTELDPFNQIPDISDHRVSGWEFWIDKDKQQSELLDYCLKVASTMEIDLLTEEDL